MNILNNKSSESGLLEEGQARLSFPKKGYLDLSVEGGELHVEPATWHPGFGVSIPNACIVVSFTGSIVTTSMSWQKNT